jgi:L,D-peptidoglycan transpeptidase YkuD (ErfK/YbiS/YcfS/YnhG family)
VLAAKREGDGATPAGSFPFRRALWRPDRWPAPPPTRLPLAALDPDDGWCDDPGDPAYNRAVRLPHPARHERMWRDDALYDLVLVIGHNDDPPLPGAGSAIFVHVARADLAPTEGCVALARADLAALAAALAPGDSIRIG